MVISLSDRQRIISQQSQVAVQLLNENNDPTDTDQLLPDDQPIDWLGAGVNPTPSVVDGLGIDEKIAMLNQAVGVFEGIKYHFINSSPKEFRPGGIVGSLENYTVGDFEPLPRATPTNYQEILRLLGQRVKTLRLTHWSSCFLHKDIVYQTDDSEVIVYDDPHDIDNNQNREPRVELHNADLGVVPSVTWTPESIGPENLKMKTSDLKASVYPSFSSYLRVFGTYSEVESTDEAIAGPLRHQDIELKGMYPNGVKIRVSAPGSAGLQISGTVHILRRSTWHQFDATGVSSRYEKNEAGYVLEGSSSGGAISLFGAEPTATFKGYWFTNFRTGGANGFLAKDFVQKGYQHKAASLNPANGDGNFENSYERNWQIGCTFFSVCEPTFTRGLDAPGMRSKLESADGILTDNSADGALLLQPRPNLFFGIDVGPGLKGGGNNYISTSPLDGHWVRYYAQYGSHVYYDWSENYFYSIVRFDSSYILQFAGSCSDYHVVYENDRSKRNQKLPVDGMGWPYPISGSAVRYETSILYQTWDRPRLRQIVGRELVADITYNTNHYGGYTVKIYRRPIVSTVPEPGQVMELSGMTLIRTWTFSHTGGAIAHPTDTEKLEVTGSAGEKYEIQANHVLPNQFTYGSSWVFYRIWWWWWLPETWSWTLKLSQDTEEKFKKEISIDNSSDGGLAQRNIILRNFLDGRLVATLTSKTLNPFSGEIPRDWVITSAGKTITGAATAGDSTDRATRYGILPTSALIAYDGIRPDENYAWDDKGLLSSFVRGLWSTSGTVEGGVFKLTHQLNSTPVSIDWIELLDGGKKVKTYSASDGTAASKSDASVAWSEVEYGTATSGLPGLPHLIKNSDGTGATYGWNASPGGSYILTHETGLLSGSTDSRGTKLIQNVNTRGHPIQTENFLTYGGSVKTTGATFANLTAWGMPFQSTDYSTGLDSTWSLDRHLSRLSSHTGTLGITSNFSAYDVLGRPGAVSVNGISSANTYNAFSTSAAITGGATGSVAETRDNLGRLTSSNTTWNGVTDNLTLTPDTSPIAITRNHGLLGTHNATFRKEDGSFASAAGPTQAFGGIAGTSLTVENGLLKTTAALGDQPATYQTTWADAWGRIRKTQTFTGTTDFLYSSPSSSIQRTCINEPNGQKTIVESDPYHTDGAITRRGIDIDGSGSLGTLDRYVESTTSVSGGKLVAILKLNEDSGLREILRTEWNPNGNQTVTKVNGNQETLTRTPNYTAKTITTTSSKGWSKTESFNNLGLTTSSTLSGTGLPTASLTPVWRGDGSLQGITFTAGGDTHSATFNHNGTLATLTAPGKGNILGGHSISSGNETLTVDGVTTITKLDGTQTTTSGSSVPHQIETLAVSGSGFKHTTAPTTGAATEVVLNAAAAPTAKNYAAGVGESHDYFPGGLLKEITLARGGKLTFGYSNDGAKDLTTATWPQVTSGLFTIPVATEGYGYDRAGRMNSVGDASGVRAIAYQNGRLASTTYTSGTLASYQILHGHDLSGRKTGIELKRGNILTHTAAIVPLNGSGEILSITSGAFTATYGRDAARNITTLTRGPVTQTWARGTGGRVTTASSNVSGAPTFNYKGTANQEATAFDAMGRRLKCATAGGEWLYQYTNERLTSTTHPALGNFNYQFDGIGRRTDMGSANTSDLLNRTLAWTNTQNKTVRVNAHPAAQVWFNGTQIPNFTGSYNHPVPSPGAAGGWFAWNTLAVLPGQGDPGAHPDAKAEQSGAVYIPPISESFTYDAAGNRESSALWNYGWDAKNQLVRQRTKSHNSVPQGYDITSAYDAEGRRFSKKVNRWQNGQIVEQKHITFLHEGNDLIYERHQLPSGLTFLERKYIWGPDISGTHGGAGGAGGLLLISETKGNVTTDLYPLYDGSGNVVALADSTGTLQAEYAYGPFGETIYARGPKADSCPFRFQTKYLDQETGLHMFKRRPYESITGQFISRDPLGESESLNLYSYCGNDPINYVDVDGLWRINTQEAANDQRVEWLLMQLSAGSGLPTAPLDEWKLYFPESGDFGLHKPYGPEDYKRAQTFVQNLGRPSMRPMTADQAAAARQPSFGSAPAWIPSATAALTLGAANTPLNASINSDWLLPTGAGAAGAKFLFGGMKTMLPMLATGARMEGRVLATEMRSGLGGVSTSPWLADSRASIVSHIERFREGGSYLVPQSTYEKWIKGKALIGRLDGQFITTRSAMDRVLRESGGDLAKVKNKLGIPDGFWNEPLVRIDVDSPLLLNARFPSGFQSGANEMFRWGGYTSGGLPEIIVNPIPAGWFRAIPTGIGP